MTLEDKLEKLTQEYNRLEDQRRAAKDKGERQRLYKAASLVDKKIGQIKDKMAERGHFPPFAFTRTEDVFQQETSYFGPTLYGSSLGDGNFWRKNGHH